MRGNLIWFVAASVLATTAAPQTIAQEASNADQCASYMSIVADYLSKSSTLWKDELKLMHGVYFSDKTPSFSGTLGTSPRAIVTLPVSAGEARTVRYTPEGGNQHSVTMCEYKRTGKSWASLQVVSRSAFSSSPKESSKGVQARMFNRTHSDLRVFAVIARADANAKFSLTLTSAVPPPVVPVSVDPSGPIKLVPHTKGTTVAPNAVVELLQPTDKSEKGPYAAWDKGKFVGVTPLYVIGGTPGKGTKTVREKALRAYLAMLATARKSGIELTITSGFRTYPEQQYFWDCYVNHNKPGHKNCNDGNQAGAPGESNHQSGEALDLDVDMGKGNASSNVATWSPVYRWLVKNARLFGFKRAVESECWHWEYRPESAAQDGTYGSWAALRAEEAKSAK